MKTDNWIDWIHILQTYKSITSKEKITLEIGSSTISRTVELAKNCKKLIGIEKFKERIPKEKIFLKYPIKIMHGDWQKLSQIIPPNSVDIVISSHVIEHVEDDVGCLNESYRVLKKGGYLLFNTPNRKRLIRSVIEIFTGDRKFPYWEHIREYTRIDLYNLVKQSYFSKSKSVIVGLGFGVHVGKYRFYINTTPNILIDLSTYWEVLLKK